jgi:hypothetical protein
MSSPKRPAETDVEMSDAKVQKTEPVVKHPSLTYTPQNEEEGPICEKIRALFGELAEHWVDLHDSEISTKFEFVGMDKAMTIRRTTGTFQFSDLWHSISLPVSWDAKRVYSFDEINATLADLQPAPRLVMLERLYGQLVLRACRLQQIGELNAELYCAFQRIGRSVIKEEKYSENVDSVCFNVSINCPTQTFHWWDLKEKRQSGWINMARLTLMHFQFINAIRV